MFFPLLVPHVLESAYTCLVGLCDAYMFGKGRQIYMFALLQTLDIQVGSVIEVVVKEIRDYGFMVELAPGVLSLLHMAQFSHDFVSRQHVA